MFPLWQAVLSMMDVKYFVFRLCFGTVRFKFQRLLAKVLEPGLKLDVPSRRVLRKGLSGKRPEEKVLWVLW